MQVVNSSLPPGLIAVTSGDLARFSEFEVSMWAVLLPQGTSWIRVRGNDIAFGRNEAIRHKLKDEHQWVWMIDDDNPYDGDLLMHLLTRMFGPELGLELLPFNPPPSIDVIQPLVSNRKPPYCPHALRIINGKHEVIPWCDMPARGVMEVDALGCGGMLIRREVLDAVGDPWFKVGQHNVEHLQEDLTFCIEAKALGFTCWVDVDHPCGHCNCHSLWPTLINGHWRVAVRMDGGMNFLVPDENGHGVLHEMLVR